MILMVVFLPFVIFFFHVFTSGRKFDNPHVVRIYFGVPGSGKTTFAAHLAKQCARVSLLERIHLKWPNKVTKFLSRKSKKVIDVYSNVPILGTYKLEPLRDLGTYQVCNGKIILDEAAIEFNNRKTKEMPQHVIKFFKLHRHYGTSIDVFSQSFDDMDITLRRLAQDYFLVKKSIIPYFICIRKIRRKIGIDENTHKITDLFKFGLPIIDSQYVFMPSVWKLFDSYDAPELPIKEFQKWTSVNAPVSA